MRRLLAVHIRHAVHVPHPRGTCSSDPNDVDPVSGYSDLKWWKKRRHREKKIKKWMNHDDAVTLVLTNQEALNLSANYAIRRSGELKETLWQWRAEVTERVPWFTIRSRGTLPSHTFCTNGKAASAKLSEVQGLRNYLGIFRGMRVMLLRNMWQRLDGKGTGGGVGQG